MDVILVDEHDNQIGLTDKMVAHNGKGLLHRAVSVIIYRYEKNKKEILLQKRSPEKTLWPEYWTNTICTHPQPGESKINCAVRRLRQEMGISIKPENLVYLFPFQYQAQFSPSLAENELDHVFAGMWSGKVTKDSTEVASYAWVEIDKLMKKTADKPDKYTPWFHKILATREFRNYFMPDS